MLQSDKRRENVLMEMCARIERENKGTQNKEKLVKINKKRMQERKELVKQVFNYVPLICTDEQLMKAVKQVIKENKNVEVLLPENTANKELSLYNWCKHLQKDLLNKGKNRDDDGR